VRVKFFGVGRPLRDAASTAMVWREVRHVNVQTVLADDISLPIDPGMTRELLDQTSLALAKVARHLAA